MSDIEDSIDLSEITIEDLKMAQEEIRDGKIHSLEDIKKEMGF